MLLARHMRMRLSHGDTRGEVWQRPGYVLIAVLIMVAVLSLLAYRFTDAMTAENRGAVRTADMTKLRAAAYSGIMYAAASLADPNTFSSVMGGSAPFANPSIFNNQSYFADQIVYTDPKDPNKNVMFSVVSVVPVATSGATSSTSANYIQQYGVIDEGGKININALAVLDPTGNTLYNVLLQLPNMTQNQQVASNIVAYVLSATAAPPKNAVAGVQSSYYEGLTNAYYAKNGPLNTLDELLFVDGVTPQLLYGNDQNMNGIADDYGSGGSNSSGSLDRGWQDYLTVNGRELNVSSLGQMRIDVNADTDKSGGTLSSVYAALQSSTINQDLVTYIMGAKLYGTEPAGMGKITASITKEKDGKIVAKISTTPYPAGTISQLQSDVQTKLQDSSTKGQGIPSLVGLANTQVILTVGKGKEAQQYAVPSPLNNNLNSYLPSLLDQATTSSQVDLVPRINLSTANPLVITALLSAIPNITQSDISSVISAQSSLVAGDPANSSGAWLVTTAGLSPAKFMAAQKFVTGTSMLYRVQAVGYYAGSENGPTSANGQAAASNWPMARVEALIDTNWGYTRIVYIRELTSLDNPRGFNLPLQQQQP